MILVSNYGVDLGLTFVKKKKTKQTMKIKIERKKKD
jgi:hypothetical protein